MLIKILPNDRSTPADKLADVELHFTDDDLAGLKLIGFSIWERTTRRFVSFPSRIYTVGGVRRAFALLRPFGNEQAKQDLETRILVAYDTFATNRALGQPLETPVEDQEASDVTSSPFASPRP